jgi:hypothetical protein
MNLKPVLNKTLLWAHTKLKLDVLCVPKKLVKYAVHSSKRKNGKNYFSSHKLPKLQSTSFWSQGNYRGYMTKTCSMHGVYRRGSFLFFSFT